MMRQRKQKQESLANRSRMRVQTWMARIERGNTLDTEEDFVDGKLYSNMIKLSQVAGSSIRF